MTLRSLMSKAADDVWFSIQEPGFSGRIFYMQMFYNADFQVKDNDVMRILRPLLGREVGTIRVVTRQNPIQPRRKCSMIDVTLAGK